MSNNSINIATFIAETARLDVLRATAIQQKLGSLGLAPKNTFEEFSDLINSQPADALSALYALGGQIPPDALTEAEKAEVNFDAKINDHFDIERTFGYYYFSSEAGRLALTNERDICMSDDMVLPRTILSAAVYEDEISIYKFQQDGTKITNIEVFPEDWQAVEEAVQELSRITTILESEEA